MKVLDNPVNVISKLPVHDITHSTVVVGILLHGGGISSFDELSVMYCHHIVRQSSTKELLKQIVHKSMWALKGRIHFRVSQHQYLANGRSLFQIPLIQENRVTSCEIGIKSLGQNHQLVIGWWFCDNEKSVLWMQDVLRRLIHWEWNHEEADTKLLLSLCWKHVAVACSRSVLDPYPTLHAVMMSCIHYFESWSFDKKARDFHYQPQTLALLSEQIQKRIYKKLSENY